MQLSDEAVTAIELWAKGFNTLIEDFIAHKERVRSNAKRLEAMGLKTFQFEPTGILPRRNKKQGSEKKKRSPEDAKRRAEVRRQKQHLSELKRESN
jgi:hypothetical protein